MKANQKLKIVVEKLSFVVAFKDIDKKLLKMVEQLEKEGNEYGPIVSTLDNLCVTLEYADKRIGAVKPTIFGHDSDEFMAKQYEE